MGLTDYLAIYGALLSTAVFAWTAGNARSKIKVRVVDCINTSDGDVRTGLHVSIQNPSSHTVHLTHVRFLAPYDRAGVRKKLVHLVCYRRLPRHVGWCYAYLSLYGIDDGCPVSLGAGQSHEIEVYEPLLGEFLALAAKPYIKFEVQDALWRSKFSPRFEYRSPDRRT